MTEAAIILIVVASTGAAVTLASLLHDWRRRP